MIIRALAVFGAILTLFLVASACNLTKHSTRMSNVLSIAWQEDRYLWVSETDKLIRWNVQTQEPEIFWNISGSLLVDARNNLWVFDQNRVHHFDGQTWEQFTPEDGFIGGYVLSIAETDECIWLGTVGLSCYNPQDKLWSVVFDTPPGSPPTPSAGDIFVETWVEGILSIAPDEEGIWVGSNRGLTYLHNNYQQTWGNDILGINGIPCLLKTNQNELWICTENGLGIWDGFQWTNFKEIPGPLALVQGKEKEIWVITDEVGIGRWNGKSWDWWTPGEGPAGLRQKSLVVSSTDGNVWVGTEKGISRWDENHWRTYRTLEGLPSDYINTIFQDPQGILWAGTNNGLSYYNPNTDRWYSFLNQ